MIAMVRCSITTSTRYPTSLRMPHVLLVLIRTSGWLISWKRRYRNALRLLAPGFRRLAEKCGRRTDGGELELRKSIGAALRRDWLRSYLDCRAQSQRYQRRPCALARCVVNRSSAGSCYANARVDGRRATDIPSTGAIGKAGSEHR